MPAAIRRGWILSLATLAAIIAALFLTLAPFANEPPADNLVAALNQARMANAAHNLDRERLVLLHAEGLEAEALLVRQRAAAGLNSGPAAAHRGRDR